MLNRVTARLSRDAAPRSSALPNLVLLSVHSTSARLKPGPSACSNPVPSVGPTAALVTLPVLSWWRVAMDRVTPTVVTECTAPKGRWTPKWTSVGTTEVE